MHSVTLELRRRSDVSRELAHGLCDATDLFGFYNADGKSSKACDVFKDPDQAITVLERGVARLPDNPYLLYLLARTYEPYILQGIINE